MKYLQFSVPGVLHIKLEKRANYQWVLGEVSKESSCHKYVFIQKMNIKDYMSINFIIKIFFRVPNFRRYQAA